MSIPVVSARTFHKRFSHGRTAPSLIEAIDAQGRSHEVVLKLFSKAERGTQAAISELVCSLLGTRLGLHAPAPFIVEVPEGFAQVVHDPAARPRFEAATGQYFGSAYMAGAPTVAADREIPAEKRREAAAIFAFDYLVQNSDRRAEKPNLLEHGDGYWLIDHDMALSFFGAGLIGGPVVPWESQALGNPAFSFLDRHLFRRGLRGHGAYIDDFQGRLAALSRVEMVEILQAVPPAWWPDSTLPKDMEDYFAVAIENGRTLCNFACTFLQTKKT